MLNDYSGSRPADVTERDDQCESEEEDPVGIPSLFPSTVTSVNAIFLMSSHMYNWTDEISWNISINTYRWQETSSFWYHKTHHPRAS